MPTMHKHPTVLLLLFSFLHASSGFVPTAPSALNFLRSPRYPIQHRSSHAGDHEILLYNPMTSQPVIRVVKDGKKVSKPGLDSVQDIYLAGDYGWGDGFHPSTRLCVEFLSTVVSHGSEKVRLDDFFSLRINPST